MTKSQVTLVNSVVFITSSSSVWFGLDLKTSRLGLGIKPPGVRTGQGDRSLG